MKTKSKTRKRLSENAEAQLRAQRALTNRFDAFVRNDLCRVTRYHADGRREILHLPMHHRLSVKKQPAKPLNAEDIKQLRECWNINQLQMARRLKVPVALLRQWEQGHAMPKGHVARLLEGMCEMLNPD